MRILLLADINSSHTHKWIEGLQACGHEIHLITLSEPENHVDTKSFAHISLGVNASTSKSRGSLAKLSYLKGIFKLRRAIHSFNPNFVHAHFASSYGLLAMLSGFRPYFVSLWGSDIMEFPNRSRLHHWLLGQILKRASKVFSTSQIMATICMKAYSIEPVVIPFGVDTNRFKPDRNTTDTSKKEMIIGTVKRLEDIYGIDVLIKAFAELKQKSTNKLRLVIAGSGSKLTEYQELSQKLEISEAVEFKGQVSHETVPSLINSFDVFANLSRRESFGVSVLEASACAIPVIVSDIEGLKEVHINNETGVSVPVNNVSETAKALENLIVDTGFREGLGTKGREFVLETYSWTDNVNAMNKHYH